MDPRNELELLCRVWRAEASQRDEILRKRDLPDEAARVAQLESSYAYRIGTEIVRAVRSPAAALNLPLRLFGLLKVWLLARYTARVSRRVQPQVRQEASAVRPSRCAAAAPVPRKAEAPPVSLAELRIAAVCDRFTADNIALECSVRFLSPGSWREELADFRPHLLFVESAWLGLGGEWKGLVSTADGALVELVECCRTGGIPTVFWNKEDPLHFEAFIETARHFDLVCTTDLESVPLYKRELGHERVCLVPFALQPRLHNPIERPADAEPASFFAGAWYDNLHERCEDFVALADALSLVARFDVFDRNASSGDPARCYPARYEPFVRGGVPYDQMAALCRRYVAGLTINTIKQSSTMYARRALELIGCGTSVYSNHCHALRLAFGDLVESTDDGERLLRIAHGELRNGRSLSHRWRRLCALRKALSEHTWSVRLCDIAERALQARLPARTWRVAIVAAATNADELGRLVGMADQQRGVECRIYTSLHVGSDLAGRVSVLSPELLESTVDGVFGAMLVAPWHPDDSYGPYYLLDMCLAHSFGFGNVVGKSGYRRLEGGKIVEREGEYRLVQSLALRRSLFPGSECRMGLGDMVGLIDSGTLDGEGLLSIDALSYLEGGQGDDLPECALAPLDHGVSFARIASMVAELQPLERLSGPAASIAGADLVGYFAGVVTPAKVSVAAKRGRLELVSKLGRGEAATLESRILDGAVAAAESVYLDAPGCAAVGTCLQQCASDGRVLRSTPLPPYTTVSVGAVAGERFRRLAFRLTGACVTYIDALLATSGPPPAPILVGERRLLLVVNGYPARESRYRNAFLHRRVKAYKGLGLSVDVVWVREGVQTTTYEFDGVEVTVCCADALRIALARTRYEAIAAHFLDKATWRAIEHAALKTRTVVWLHGAEIQSWERRQFNYTTSAEIEDARAAWEERRGMWRELFSGSNGLWFVFVSSSFMREVIEDTAVPPEDRRLVIHNPIDTRLFRYEPKQEGDRWKILSIRPHASRIYANDIVAAVIHRLSREPEFESMRFHLVGDGELFDCNFDGLRRYANVMIDRRFLSQEEVAQLHRGSGIFLVPTRGDTHGVSRDEAMSSGLVPVTCAAGSVPEFVDDGCGIVTAVDDVEAMAEGVLRLVRDPSYFMRLSAAAAERVRRQSAADKIVEEELRALALFERTVRKAG